MTSTPPLDETGWIRSQLTELCLRLDLSADCIGHDLRSATLQLVRQYNNTFTMRDLEIEKAFDAITARLENQVLQHAPSFQLEVVEMAPFLNQAMGLVLAPNRSSETDESTQRGSTPQFLRRGLDVTKPIEQILQKKRLECCFSKYVRISATVSEVLDAWRATDGKSLVHRERVKKFLKPDYSQGDTQTYLLPHNIRPTWEYKIPKDLRAKRESSATLCIKCFKNLACISSATLYSIQLDIFNEWLRNAPSLESAAKDVVEQVFCCQKRCVSKLDPNRLKSVWETQLKDPGRDSLRGTSRSFNHLADRIRRRDSGSVLRSRSGKVFSKFHYFAPVSVFVPSKLTIQQQQANLIKVCAYSFQLVHQLSRAELESIQSKFNLPENTSKLQLDLVSSPHGNTGREPVNKLTAEQKKLVLSLADYIRFKCCEPYGGVKLSDNGSEAEYPVYIVPLWCTESSLYALMKCLFELKKIRPFSASAFAKLWKEATPDLIPAKRRTATCDTCELFQVESKGKPTPEQIAKQKEHLAHSNALKDVIRWFSQKSERDTENVRRAEELKMNESRDEDEPYVPMSLDLLYVGLWNKNDIVLTIVCDYQEAFAIPHLTSTPADFFFHHQMWIYNFGMWTPLGMFNAVYHEITAGKGSTEIISILDRLLLGKEELLKKLSPKWLVVISDGCGGQVHNRYVLAYLHQLMVNGHVDRVTHVIHVRGHSKMKPDGEFGKISKKLNVRNIYSAQDFITVTSSISGMKCLDMENPPEQFRAWKEMIEAWKYVNLEGISKARWVDMNTPGEVTMSNLPPIEILQAAGVPAEDFEICSRTRWSKTVRFNPHPQARALKAPLAPLKGLSKQKVEDIDQHVWKYVIDKSKWPWSAVPEMLKNQGKLLRPGETTSTRPESETNQERERRIERNTIENYFLTTARSVAMPRLSLVGRLPALQQTRNKRAEGQRKRKRKRDEAQAQGGRPRGRPKGNVFLRRAEDPDDVEEENVQSDSVDVQSDSVDVRRIETEGEEDSFELSWDVGQEDFSTPMSVEF